MESVYVQNSDDDCDHNLLTESPSNMTPAAQTQLLSRTKEDVLCCSTTKTQRSLAAGQPFTLLSPRGPDRTPSKPSLSFTPRKNLAVPTRGETDQPCTGLYVGYLSPLPPPRARGKTGLRTRTPSRAADSLSPDSSRGSAYVSSGDPNLASLSRGEWMAVSMLSVSDETQGSTPRDHLSLERFSPLHVFKNDFDSEEEGEKVGGAPRKTRRYQHSGGSYLPPTRIIESLESGSLLTGAYGDSGVGHLATLSASVIEIQNHRAERLNPFHF